MNETLNLPYIGLQISEEEYRNLPYFSYSIISDFQSRGHKALYEDKDVSNKKGIIRGNLLDRMISTRQFHPEHVFILNSEDIPSDSIKNIIEYFINNTKELPEDLNNCSEIHKGTLLAGALNENYGQTWKTDTLLTKIIQNGNKYYCIRKESKQFSDSIIVSTDEFEKASDSYRTLLSNEYVCMYLVEDENDTDHIIMYDQVKFVHSELKLKGMLDRVIINYTKKTITPIDFKNIGFDERSFGKTNYISFNYDIQSSVYTELLSDYIKTVPELEDFIIEDFKFIVINLDNLAPLVFISQPIDITRPLYFKNSMSRRKTWYELYEEMLQYDLTEYNPYTLEERELKGIIQLDLFTQNPEL